jgi:homocysteine S-methyltransferase
LCASYRPDLHPPHEEAAAHYKEIAQIQGPVVDLIICETVASVTHARAVLEAAKSAGRPVWLALTLDDENGLHLRSGEAVADALAVAETGGADAILANCSVPEVMSAGLDVFAMGELPFGAYANGFTHIASGFLEDAPTVDALSARKDLGAVGYAEFALRWVNQGATIVGGCCEVGPQHILEVHRTLVAEGHKIV